MFLGERMSHPAIMVDPEMPIQEALKLLHKEHIRRLPVSDARGRLLGSTPEAISCKQRRSQRAAVATSIQPP